MKSLCLLFYSASHAKKEPLTVQAQVVVGGVMEGAKDRICKEAEGKTGIVSDYGMQWANEDRSDWWILADGDHTDREASSSCKKRSSQL